MDIKEINKQLNKYTESKGRLYFKLSYKGKEIDTLEISIYVGNIIPEDFDVSKFEIKVGDTQILETMERYLSVEPGNNEFNDSFSCYLVLMEGDKRVQEIGIDPRIVQDRDAKEIIEIAKDHFDNITDDIRVQWY